jgi:hypothetical protein
MSQTVEALAILAAAVQVTAKAFNDATAAATAAGIAVNTNINYAPPMPYVEGQPPQMAKATGITVTSSYPL